MTPLDRQLDRIGRDVPLGASVEALRPLDGPALPAGPTLYGCTCGHSRHLHRGYRECQRTGCTCWTYRPANQSQTESAPAADATGSGARDPQEKTP